MDNRHDSETVRLCYLKFFCIFLHHHRNLTIKCGTIRNKCAACFRQYNKVEHLVEHMRVSFHSVHEPKCGICQKHCRFFESLREHLIGKRCLKLEADLITRHLYSKYQMISLLKDHCRRLNVPGYSELKDVIYASTSSKVQMLLELTVHHANFLALLRRANIPNIIFILLLGAYLSDVEVELAGLIGLRHAKSRFPGSCFGLQGCRRRKRWITRPVCQGLPDRGRRERYLPNLYQAPNTGHKLQVPLYETTGIRPEYLRDAIPLKQAQRRIQDFFSNGEPIWKIRSRGGKARILVGHGLDRDLDCLGVEYPAVLIRDTAVYPPLMKTSKLSNSLKYLTQAYLGYDIQTGTQDPYEDCVAAMRLYIRMRSQNHPRDYASGCGENRNNYPAWRQRELEKMTPDALLELSASDYYCWCLDS
ncbi:hypothetical protein MUK42_28002 [Musa troglodytarum]|uniref:C2H2-type domain-containing protein n=1 Tax=Musa troglodytarum TaxID=320322 RepID=A0A9E7EYT6_9LILI|nr:hypothetical protein MUK42_28002 [Musa troglodytarum]